MSTVLPWARTKMVEVFGADLRSLAAFRIVMSLVVLGDLANRSTDLVAHYTDQGLMPRSVLLEEVANPWWFSLNLMNGQPFFQALLFGVAALAALGLLVGYRTRLMTVIVWALVLSIEFRNPLLSTSGNVLLHVLLFWAMFLPLGAVWSVDRALKVTSSRISLRFLSVATFGLFMQIAFMYWFTALMKTGREWRVDGTALYYTLSLGRYASPLGDYLLQFPELMEMLTFATMGLEAFGPFFLFFPFFTGPIRTATVMAFMSFHLGIYLTMDIGHFPWLAGLCMVCFLPTWFWDRAAKLHDVFPGVTNLAHRLRHGTGHLLSTYWSPLRTRFFSGVGVGPTSVLSLAARGNVNQLRSSTFTRTSTSPAEPEAGKSVSPGAGLATLRSSRVTNMLALVFLLYIFWWNLATVNAVTMPERIIPFGQFFGIEQNWNMFAPAPDRDDYWFVIPGTLQDGREVDLMSVTRDDYSLHKVSWEEPTYVSKTYKNSHWLKYLDSIVPDDRTNLRPYFAYYLCREWNARHAGAEQLRSLQITYMWQKTLPDNRHTTPQKVVMLEYSCF